MESNHRTHLLFIEPVNPPTENPIEDDLTTQLDFIFSQLIVIKERYRGHFVTRFGKASDNGDYAHPVFPLVSNSLARYYIRYHRVDISPKQLTWIKELYGILKDPDNYYKLSGQLPKTLSAEHGYYFKLYENPGKSEGYGEVCTYAVKIVGAEKGIQNLLQGTFFRILSEKEFQEEIKNMHDPFHHTVEGCSLVEVYDVLKKH